MNMLAVALWRGLPINQGEYLSAVLGCCPRFLKPLNCDLRPPIFLTSCSNDVTLAAVAYIFRFREKEFAGFPNKGIHNSPVVTPEPSFVDDVHSSGSFGNSRIAAMSSPTPSLVNRSKLELRQFFNQLEPLR